MTPVFFLSDSSADSSSYRTASREKTWLWSAVFSLGAASPLYPFNYSLLIPPFIRCCQVFLHGLKPPTEQGLFLTATAYIVRCMTTPTSSNNQMTFFLRN